MRPALLLLGCAVAVAWWAPALLTRLTSRGITARLGLAAWLTAMMSTLALASAALQFLVKAAIAGWSGLARVVCRSLSGHACAAAVYQSAAFDLGLGVTATVAVLAAIVLAWRYGRSVQRAQRQTRAHAEAVRITGRELPGGADQEAAGRAHAIVLDEAAPAAYCVSGRPATIVLTSGALALLDPAQLASVLAHERAHLAGRHHLMIALTRGLAAAFPGVPLFTKGTSYVARLAEMCADDAAASRHGRPTLITALVAMATGTAVPGSALGAAACAVSARVQRLLDIPARRRHARYALGLATVTVLLAMLPGIGNVFATAVAAHPGVLG